MKRIFFLPIVFSFLLLLMATSAFSQTLNLKIIFDIAQGNVTRNPLGPLYMNGDVVELTATPMPGYIFDKWTGDVTGTTNPTNASTTVTMNSAKTVTANELQNL